jgi:hypothetical protein
MHDQANVDVLITEQLVQRIRPLLAGHPLQVQSAVLAELLSFLLAGLSAPDGNIVEVRSEFLAEHIRLALDLVRFS